MTKPGDLAATKKINKAGAYNFFYWGPILFKTQLQPKDLKKCAELCSKKASLVTDTLAGVIEHEHYINTSKFYEIVSPYLDFFRHGYDRWYGGALNRRIVAMKSWANFMIAGEFNPPHIHSYCDFSSVLFVKIPEKLKEEHEKFPGSGSGPATLSFLYGESQPYSINHINFFPHEGDFFIFPATLTHFVAPFMSPGERISISTNFKLE